MTRSHYNDGVNSARAAQLLEINRRFYLEHGTDFAETRRRIQPGVRRVMMQTVGADDTILDLGCGSGALALALSQKGHRGRYLGLDSSPVAVQRANSQRYDFQANFVEGDLASPHQLEAVVQSYSRDDTARGWDVVTAFAVMHHIPGTRLRLEVLSQARAWTRAGGSFLISNWQFTASDRMRPRIQPWSAVGLSENDVDEGDYLVEWRRGGLGLRYVHEFGERELTALAEDSGFRTEATFLSDGADRRSGLYQIWRPA